MAIAKRPVSNRADIDKFISGAGDKAAAKPAKKPAPEKEPKREPVLIRVPPDLLQRIDEAAKQRGVSRAAWLVSVASRALDEGGW